MISKRILVATTPDDIHAAMVFVALREIGHEVTLWILGDLPENSTAAWSLNDASDDLNAFQLNNEIPVGKCDVFWLRRLSDTRITQNIHPADHAMAVNETRSFVRGLLSIASRRSLAVNGFPQAMAAEIKPTQLIAAKQVGLTIPNTLISNDPERIRMFISSQPPGSTIYKPFTTTVWKSERGSAYSYTTTIEERDLPSATILRLTPGIFQEKISKQFEVRVTCMGRRLVAVKLDSQSIPGAELDWRCAQTNPSLCSEEIQLPSEIKNKCLQLMDVMKLRFGCIDFVVKPSGEWVFLEINQMGQFLWIESANPDIPMLDYFLNFIIDPNGSESHPTRFGVTYREFYDEANETMELMRISHQSSSSIEYVYQE